jgi:hypothetical protein
VRHFWGVCWLTELYCVSTQRAVQMRYTDAADECLGRRQGRKHNSSALTAPGAKEPTHLPPGMSSSCRTKHTRGTRKHMQMPSGLEMTKGGCN